MSIQFLKFIKAWNSGLKEFEIQTSGSTGKPKSISLHRDQMVYSATQTYKELGFHSLTKIYNCIPVDKIGGFMNWVRAVHFKLDIQTVNPSADPMEHLSNNHNFTFVSLVPYQLYSILKKEDSKAKLDRFTTVLIGGAELNTVAYSEVLEMSPIFWESYGMTETCSHIALKKIGEKEFKPIGDIRFTQGDDEIIEISGSVTRHEKLTLTDILKFDENRNFSIVGRRDFIINSGGIKLSPESIERKIIEKNPNLLGAILCTSEKDMELGERVILLVSRERMFLDLSNLTTYEKPKKVIWEVDFQYTAKGKIDRMAVYQIKFNI